MTTQTDFELPLEGLEVVEAKHVIQFKVLSNSDTPNGMSLRIETSTRGGFKLYEDGMSARFEPKDQLGFPLDIKPEASPVTQFDPFSKKNQTFFLDGSKFVLSSPTFLDSAGTILLTVRSCSPTKCLFPTTFAVKPTVGSVSGPSDVETPFAVTTTTNTTPVEPETTPSHLGPEVTIIPIISLVVVALLMLSKRSKD